MVTAYGTKGHQEKIDQAGSVVARDRRGAPLVDNRIPPNPSILVGSNQANKTAGATVAKGFEGITLSL